MKRTKTKGRSILWQYMSGNRFIFLHGQEELSPETELLHLPGEKPAVWFSSNQLFEESVRRRIIAWENGETDSRKTAGVVRIGVRRETAPISWGAFKRISGMPRRMARTIEKAAKKEPKGDTE